MELQPSQLISELVQYIENRPRIRGGMRAIMERSSEFSNEVEAQLTGVSLDPIGRAAADSFLDELWQDDRERVFTERRNAPEVIIGSGFHAAVYAANRVLSGYSKPLVLERTSRPGRVFALTERPTFYLNSRNRPGNGGIAGDMMASLNYLPGAPIQASNVSMTEYQTNADMAFVIRLTLAQFADVIPNAEVTDVSGLTLSLKDGRDITPQTRIIDARGLGDPANNAKRVANGSTILTFPQFMQRMGGMWPLRGLNRVAVVGGGDSGKCAVESLLGISPQPYMATVALDNVSQVDWYSRELPNNCDDWQSRIRGRYQAIGRYLRPDRKGFQRLTVRNRIASPVALPSGVQIAGRTYDLVVMATGYTESDVAGIPAFDYANYRNDYPGAEIIAQKAYDREIYRVGPHARIPFNDREREDGIAEIAQNLTAMFRLGGKTAELAVSLTDNPVTNF